MDYVKIGDLVARRFQITGVVGSGSFAWVFTANDEHTGQTVAIKMLRLERYADEDALRRFESRELRLLERIEKMGHSPHVVRLVEKNLLRHDGLPFLVLEYIDGPSMKEWLAENGRLEIEEVARIGVGLARGLAMIHAAGGVHRDLKPSNVRMRHGQIPVLVDLGIARALWETQKLTQGNAPLTPRYAAPEQREGLPVTPAADMYAFGVCLHEMIARQKHVPARLTNLIAHCLSADPHSRPTAKQAEQILDALANPQSLRSMLRSLTLFSVCLLVPWGQLHPHAHADKLQCVPLTGFVQEKVHHDVLSPDTTLEWSHLDAEGKSVGHIEMELTQFDPVPRLILDDGGDGHYEIWGWFGDRCRRFSVQACLDRAYVQDLGRCALSRPVSAAGSTFAWGGVTGSGFDDILLSSPRPTASPKSLGRRGMIVQRRDDGSSTIIHDAFDLSAIDAYHLEYVPRTGDIDRDGCADLVVTTYPNGGSCVSSIYVMFGDCHGHFTLSDHVAYVPTPVNRSDIGDVDEDGFLDLVTGPDDDGDPGQTYLLRGTSQGFGDAEELIDVFPNIEHGNDQPGHGSASLEDWNGDGHLDVLLLVMMTPLGGSELVQNSHVYLGRGDGSFDDAPAFIVDDIEAHGHIRFLPIRGR